MKKLLIAIIATTCATAAVAAMAQEKTFEELIGGEIANGLGPVNTISI